MKRREFLKTVGGVPLASVSAGRKARIRDTAAVLVEALMAAKRRGLRLLLCSPSESVLRMFRLAGFEEVLDHCCSTPEETRRRLLE